MLYYILSVLFFFSFHPNIFPPTPECSVIGVNVIADQIVECKEEYDALLAPLVNVSEVTAVNVQAVELNEYCFEDLQLSVLQILDPTFPLGDAQSNRVKSLVASIRVLTFNHCN